MSRPYRYLGHEPSYRYLGYEPLLRLVVLLGGPLNGDR
jgi:hypothetical protein